MERSTLFLLVSLGVYLFARSLPESKDANKSD